MRKMFELTALVLAATLPALPANAAMLVALTGDDRLVTVDTETRAATGSAVVAGVDGRLLGIDVRPADGKLYGLFVDGTVATIDPAGGTASPVAVLKTVPAAGATATVDFNPAADAMRIMGSDGSNLRTKIAGGAVTEDGRHAFAAGDAGRSGSPRIVAGAYTNAYAGTQATALYNVDGAAGALVRQDPPNDGTLKTVGKLGVAPDATVGFDIQSDGRGGNRGWLVSGGTLHEVDLETGAASPVGRIEGLEGSVRDIAVLPAT